MIPKIKTDCRHFPLDRPCVLHKERGVTCDRCGQYLSLFPRRSGVRDILIIKLGAMGDVLRTTFLLPGLKAKYPGCRITWVVDPRSAGILAPNPYLEAVWPREKDLIEKLVLTPFDLVINLDLAPESLALATLAVARKRVGFWLAPDRKIRSSNSAAEHWLAMSGRDDIKKDNPCTYQHWMAKICGLPRADYEIFTPLLKPSVARAGKFAARHHLKGAPVIGINPGAGQRWKLKRWTDRGYIRLIGRLKERGYRILLLGGPDEKALIGKLAKAAGGAAVNGGTDNSLPDFFALLNLCDLLVTGDTLALHAACGLRKKTLALFGPTSAAEIELYGRGMKIVTPAPCACCYRPSCDVRPTCMDRIALDDVADAVEFLLKGKA